MKVDSIVDYIGSKTYPGRTIFISCGQEINLIYLLMGRSSNSQNRILLYEDGVVSTQAYDPEKLEDPDLIIYKPYRQLNNRHILTNGDQTDTIYKALMAGQSMYAGLLSRTFEPDPPNFTPRISLLLEKKHYEFSLIKAGDPFGQTCNHFHFHYELMSGLGHCIHTYQDNGDPLPSFAGEPVTFPHESNLGEKIWQAADPVNKVSLLELSIERETNDLKNVKIFNKWEGD